VDRARANHHGWKRQPTFFGCALGFTDWRGCKRPCGGSSQHARQCPSCHQYTSSGHLENFCSRPYAKLSVRFDGPGVRSKRLRDDTKIALKPLKTVENAISGKTTPRWWIRTTFLTYDSEPRRRDCQKMLWMICGKRRHRSLFCQLHRISGPVLPPY
jgi:hypothetical protein